MIVDVHAHVFPYLGEASGFASRDEHHLFLQLYLAMHGQPVRRLCDHTLASDVPLGDGTYAGPEAFTGTTFRVGRCGRFEWEYHGETYYRQFLPPSMQNMAAPPDFLVQAMAHAGIDVAILQNARPYGRLNDYFAQAQRAYPGKLYGLADVNEPHAHEPAEIARLRKAVLDQGLVGIYYANRGFFPDHYTHTLDDVCYDPFWEEVRRLRLPVFWEILGVPTATPANYLREIDRLNRWADRHPGIPSVLTHGIDPAFLRGNVPEPLARLLRREQFLIEVLYPISQGRTLDYPYSALRPVLHYLYRTVGGTRLVWGSDMPNVERHCTYCQSRTYLEEYATFISSADLERILGGNALSLLGLHD
jgi:predicted TIM-barrel fold metal-dependent hydrolase